MCFLPGDFYVTELRGTCNPITHYPKGGIFCCEGILAIARSLLRGISKPTITAPLSLPITHRKNIKNEKFIVLGCSKKKFRGWADNPYGIVLYFFQRKRIPDSGIPRRFLKFPI